ncbi:hypothetical protein ACH47B_26270 [Rhodococcus sp. NPDC019627]|uniref:hypothetical protein n=1 Tax=unclassified Rhodococcus (in: high G+C Gram-positive bacteria) TaxID=192944 RepID=UPI0033DEC84C
MMWRTLVVAFFAIMLPMLLCCGPAAAQPTAVPAPGPGGSAATKSAKELPTGFPANLKQFVAGTDEFKSAPWFTGDCKDKGGDIGQYVGAVMAQEHRLLYWTATEQARLAMWGPAVAMNQNPALAEAVVAAGGEGTTLTGIRLDNEKNRKAVLSITDESVLAANVYPPVYPEADTRLHPPNPTCADDVAGWTTKTSSTWGFDWASTPDAASLATMKSQPYADLVPGGAWNDTCASDAPAALCMHAMFVNCDKTNRMDDKTACTAWNTKIGALFGHTMNWIDQNTSFSDRLEAGLESAFQATPQYKAGKMYADGFSWVWDNTVGALGDVVDFVKDPSDVIDSWANKLKAGSISTTNAVLHGMAGVGEFDPANQSFLAIYAASAGLGILVMAVMTLLAIYKSTDGNRPPIELAKDLFAYMPAGIVAMMFAPLIAQMVISLAHEISNGVLDMIGTSTDEVVGNISSALGPLTDATLVGGAIAAIVGFGLLFLGGLSMFSGLLMHSAALPLLAVVCAIAFGMWVHPVWRKKALRPVMTFLGIVFSKPLLFILLGTIFAVINTSAQGAVADDGELESLGQLSLIAVCFVILGLAPFSLLKYGPILPTSADSADFGSSGSSAGQVLGSTAGMYQMAASGGGGGAEPHNAGAATAPGRDGGGYTGNSHAGGGGGHAPSAADQRSASSTHAASAGHQTQSPSGGHSGSKSGAKSAAMGSAETKLVGAAAGASTAMVAPIALAAAGAALNKTASAVQNAPEHADGEN